ncbi:MAG: hypothetical protein AABY75_05555 [Bacteroidota bacterium]
MTPHFEHRIAAAVARRDCTSGVEAAVWSALVRRLESLAGEAPVFRRFGTWSGSRFDTRLTVVAPEVGEA